MSSTTRLPLFIGFLGLTGCPGEPCPPPPPPCEDCSKANATATTDWAAALASLSGELASAPPGPTGAPSEILEGEVNIWSPRRVLDSSGTLGARIGDIYADRTTASGTTNYLMNEQWVMFNFGPTLPNADFELWTCQTGCGALTTDAMTTYRTAETTAGTDHKLAAQLVEYRVFPSAAIGGLPEGLPSNTTNVAFRLDTIKSTSTVSETGYLYREITTFDSRVVWTDHWVLFENFELVGGSVAMGAVKIATPYAGLKAFMVDMDAKRNQRTPENKVKWRYVQSPGVWRDL